MNLASKKNLIILSLIFALGLVLGGGLDNFKTKPITADELELNEEEASIRAIQSIIPATVNIIVYEEEETLNINLETGERTSKKEIIEKGSGTGFLISPDGLILTNKHVINVAKVEEGQYRVILNSGKKYYAQFIGNDPINDLAVLKIFDKNLPYVKFGNSDKLRLGTTVIAIGNALGRYQNSVTKGIVSGLGRNLVASDGFGNLETLNNVIQTDAQINLGNSGGPLIDLHGNVVGVNVAIDRVGQSIGFAIAINDAWPVIKSVRETGRIARPMLGVHYIMLDPQTAQERDLPLLNGAYIIPFEEGGVPGIVSGSSAEIAGLEEGDIIFEIDDIELKGKNTLLSLIQRYKPGDVIGMKIQRGDKVIIRVARLGEFTNNY